MDLAESHVHALMKIKKEKKALVKLNIGTGIGTSVFDLVKKFSQVNKCKVPIEFCDRRLGDVSILVANNEKASKYLNWVPKRDIEQMCIDGWKWFKSQIN